MWYLHKIQLRDGVDLASLARVITRNAYSEHQTLWKMFDAPAEKRTFLFRRERFGHRPSYYLLAERPAADSSGVWSIQAKEFRPQLHTGQRLAFALRANPTRARKASGDPHDRKRLRDDVVMRAKIAERAREANPSKRASQMGLVQRAGPAWLNDRAERNGFAIESLHVDGYHQHRLFKRSHTSPIRFSTLDYHGILQITDLERFSHALHKGIGPAKAFGCGLLLIRRVG